MGGISANAVPIQAQESLPEVTYGQIACFDYVTLAERAFWDRQEGWGRKYVKSATIPYPPAFPVIDLVYAWPLTDDTYADRDAIRDYIAEDCARAARMAEEEIATDTPVVAPNSADDLGINYLSAYTCRDFGTMATQAIAWRSQGLSREGAKARTNLEAAHPIIDLAFRYPTTGDYLHDANRFGTLIVENCSIQRGW